MSFIKDLLKRFNNLHTEQKAPEPDPQDPSLASDLKSDSEINPEVLNTKPLLDNFDHQQADLESLDPETIILNLRALKGLLSQPKEEKPEIRFSQMQSMLGTPECFETIRQDRWYLNIYCPDCLSTRLKRLAQVPPQSVHNHRYRCLDCGTTFNDDTGTPIEKGVPPLHIWMQCWYLMGCTDSLSYIAHKLGLDLSTVEKMARQLQKTFSAKQPLTRFIGFTEWHKQSQHLRNQLKDDLMRQYEKLNANVATQPTDTAEFRRQESLRRDPSMKTPTGTKKTR
jgi:transposase-like protein